MWSARIECQPRRRSASPASRGQWPGLSDNVPRNGRVGIGLRNTRARLERLYGAEHAFLLGRSQWGGLLITIEVPLRDPHVKTPAVGLLNKE